MIRVPYADACARQVLETPRREMAVQRYGSPLRRRENIPVELAPGSICPQGIHFVHAAIPTPSGCPQVGHIGRKFAVCQTSPSQSMIFHFFESARSSWKTLSGLSSKTMPKLCEHGVHDLITARRPCMRIRAPNMSLALVLKRSRAFLTHASGGCCNVGVGCGCSSYRCCAHVRRLEYFCHVVCSIKCTCEAARTVAAIMHTPRLVLGFAARVVYHIFESTL